ADVDEDGAPDLVVTSYYDSSLAILRGMGDGSFVPAEFLNTGAQARAVEVADMDLDGHLDLVVTQWSDWVRVLKGDGAGGFTIGPAYASGYDPWDIAVADVNGDGWPDIMTANRGTSRCCGSAVGRLSTGGGEFGSAATLATRTWPQGIALADFNEDGNLDI